MLTVAPTSLHRWVAVVVGLIVAGHRDRRLADPARPPGARAARAVRPASCTPIQVARRRAAGPDRSSPAGPRRSTSPSARSSGRCWPGSRSRATTRPGSAAGRGTGHRRPASARDRRSRRPRRRARGATRPRLHRPDQAADHRAAARHHGPGDGPRHARRSPGIDWRSWGGSSFWTLIGGTLAAGQRQRHQLLPRPRHRPADDPHPAPAAAGPPGRARDAPSCSASCSASSRSSSMAWFVNLLAAFLTLLAIAFYVVVYTMLLKRTTPQNIVIGGAAGALPPVIGWAAVTGERRDPGAAPVRARLLLDAAALLGAVAADPQGLRRGRRADAPGREGHPRDDPPDRPVHDPDGRDLAGPVGGRAGWASIYLVAAVVLGAMFLWQAYRLWRHGNVRGGVDGRRDPPVQVLDLLPDAAVRRGRGRRPGARRH